MATVAKSTRSTTITLASASAGPFDLDFRLFDDDGVDVYVNGLSRTDWTLTAAYDDGFDDNATITFAADLDAADVIVVDSALSPHRDSDYIDGPGLTKKLNIEFARIWSALSDLTRDTGRSLRIFGGADPIELGVGQTIIRTADGVEAGPTGTEISNAQGYALEAKSAAATVGGAMPNFATRAGLVGWRAGGGTSIDGRSFKAGGLTYVWQDGATAFPDLPDMLPVAPFVLEHWGVEGGVFEDQVTKFKAAVDWAGGQGAGTKVSGYNGPYYIRSTLRIENPMWLYLPHGSSADDNRIEWMQGGGYHPVIVMKKATEGKQFDGGRIDALIDAQNFATHCLICSSPDHTIIGDVTTYRSTQKGTVLDDGNGALMNNPRVINLQHHLGANVLAWNCDGFEIDGDTSSYHGTQVYVEQYAGEYVSGDAFVMKGVDNCTIDNVMPIERMGEAITGKGVRLAKSVNYPDFQLQKINFGHIGRGEVYIEDNVSFAYCDFLNGEGSSVVFESPQGTANRGTFFYNTGDRNNGAFYHDRVPFRLLEKFPVNIMNHIAVAGSPVLEGYGGLGVPTITFGWTATETVSFGALIPAVDTGDVVGIDIAAIQWGTSVGDVLWRITGISKAIDVGLGGAEITADLVQTMGGVASTMSRGELMFGSALPANRGDMIHVALSRIGGDEADTFGNNVGLVALSLIYKADGPNAPGSGPYEVSDLIMA